MKSVKVCSLLTSIRPQPNTAIRALGPGVTSVHGDHRTFSTRCSFCGANGWSPPFGESLTRPSWTGPQSPHCTNNLCVSLIPGVGGHRRWLHLKIEPFRQLLWHGSLCHYHQWSHACPARISPPHPLTHVPQPLPRGSILIPFCFSRSATKSLITVSSGTGFTASFSAHLSCVGAISILISPIFIIIPPFWPSWQFFYFLFWPLSFFHPTLHFFFLLDIPYSFFLYISSSTRHSEIHFPTSLFLHNRPCLLISNHLSIICTWRAFSMNCFPNALRILFRNLPSLPNLLPAHRQ